MEFIGTMLILLSFLLTISVVCFVIVTLGWLVTMKLIATLCVAFFVFVNGIALVVEGT